jgi:hypothetical protein
LSTLTSLGFNLTARTEELEAGLESGSGSIQKFADKAASVMAMAGAAAGVALVAGFAEAAEQMNATSMLQAQLGTTGKVAAQQGKLAGKLFSKGVTDSFQEGADAIKAISQNGLAPPGTTIKQLESIATKAIDLSKVFGQEVGPVSASVSQMLRTGLVKSADEAFDILSKGFQNGANKADDLLDTMNEYGTQFRKAGVSGKQALGIISQGMQAGARDADIVADAIKEFSIRAVDGSKLSAQGFKDLGLSATEMTNGFAKGGKTANGILDITLDKLRNVKDPVKQAAIATALFGTQSEDLGKALFKLDPSKAVGAMGAVGGGAKKLGDTLRSGPIYEFQKLQRTIRQSFVDFLTGQVAPAAMGFITFMKGSFVPGMQSVGSSVLDVLPIDALQARFTKGKKLVSDFLKGLKGTGKAKEVPGPASYGMLQPAVKPQQPTPAASGMLQPSVSQAMPKPASQAEQFGKSINAAIKDLDTKALGELLGKALGKAFQISITTIGDVGKYIIDLMGKVDWVNVGGAVGKTMIPFVIGVIVHMFDALFDPSFWKEHWSDLLIAVITIIPIGKALGVLGKVLGKIPFVGKFGEWLAKLAGPLAKVFDSIWKPIWNGIKSGFTSVIPRSEGAIGNLFAKIGEKVGAVKEFLKGKAVGALEGLGSGIGQGVAKALVFIADIGKKIAAPFVRAGTWLVEKGLAIVRGLRFGLITAAQGIGAWVKSKTVTPIVNTFRTAGTMLLTRGRDFISGLLRGIREKAAGIGSWVTRIVVTPAIRAFDALKSGVSKIKSAFGVAVTGIKSAWGKLKEVTRDPVRFFVQTVYNNGLRRAWNSTAGKIPGVPDMPAASLPRGFAKGGYLGTGTKGPMDKVPIMAQAGEYVIKAKRVREIGKSALDWLNSGSGAQASPRGEGLPGYALGGLIPNPMDVVKRAGGVIKGGIDWGTGLLKSAAGKAVGELFGPFNGLVNGITSRFPDAGIVGTHIKQFATAGFKKMADFVKGKASDDGGGNGTGGTKAAQALAWARTQNGKKYQWGGNGNPSWDCSGFTSAIESVIRGQKPHRRWSTHAFSGKTAPPGWTQGLRSAYQVGITAAGVGHTAGTLSGVNVESRGGRGVIVGKGARGAHDKLFTSVYGYNSLKYADGGMVPTQRMDSGGTVPRGLSLINNTTGAPERLNRVRGGASGKDVHYHFDFRGAVVTGNAKQVEDMVVAGVRRAEDKGRIKKGTVNR